MDELLARRTKRKTEKTQITKVKNDTGDITIDFTKIKKIISEYHGQLYMNKLDNLDELHKFWETPNLPKLNHENIGNISLLRASQAVLVGN